MTGGKTGSITLVIVLIVILATIIASISHPAIIPLALLLIAGFSILAYWAVRWDMVVLPFIWVLSYGLLDWPQWRWESSFFFNMTVPRFIFLAVIIAFAMHFLLRREPLRWERVFWMILALLLYCAISATVKGWILPGMTPPARGAPYFRFLAAMVFPILMCFCIYNTTRREDQIRRVLILLSIYGWYALYIGYLQYAAIMGLQGARAFIWPDYINDPFLPFAHHFDRARGAFYAANPQANLLITLLYADLYLIRRIRNWYRVALIIQVILIPPAIFFTGLRASYVGLVLGAIIWCLWGCKGRLGKTKLVILFLAIGLGVVIFWNTLTRRPAAAVPARPAPAGPTYRATGGVVQVGPIISRLVLLARTGDLVKLHPFTGVGFGHYIEADKQVERDPTSLSSLYTAITPISTPANLFLVMVAETGLIGLALIIAVFVLIFRRSVQLYRRLPDITDKSYLSKDFAVLFWIVMVVYLNDGTFVDILWDVPSNGLFWASVGLMLGYYRMVVDRSSELEDKSEILEGHHHARLATVGEQE